MSKVSSSLSKEEQRNGGATDSVATAMASASTEDVKSEDLAPCFAMTEEVRIIIVKLADRLHNMRTLEG